MPGRPAPRVADLALVLVFAGTALRVWQWALGSSLWLDEQMIAMNLRDRDFAHLTGQLDNNQSAPLGWLWLERALVDLFGTGERTLRLVPLLFGIGLLVVAWLIGRRYLGPVGTFALVGFCAVNEALLVYSTQAKHYTADAFFVLLLLGMAAWVVERPTLGRAGAWWSVAAAGSWLSMGATLAAPGFVLVMFVVAARVGPRPSGAASLWRRWRWWPAIRNVALPGVAWLALFAVHYQLSLRFSTGSDYLADFWDGLGYPPHSGLLATARWLLRRPEALASDPLHLASGLPGDVLPMIVGGLFWLLVAAGLVLAARRRPAYGLLLAAPAGSALALAILRMVPLAIRLALWLVPVLFVAVAIGLDAAARLLVRARRPVSPVTVATTGAAAICLTLLVALVPFSASAVRKIAGPPEVDDRDAVAWMRAEHRPGDLVLVVGSATRALQWYDPERRLLPTRMVVPAAPGADCDPSALITASAKYSRVIAYSGIRASPYKNAHEVLARRLAELGTITETRTFGGTDSIVYVVKISASRPPASPAATAGMARAAGPPQRLGAGECLVIV